MAVSITLKEDGRVSTLVYRVAEIIFDAAYANGGEAVNPSQLGMSRIVAAVAVDSPILVGWDPANNKLKAYYPSVDADVAATLTTALTGADNDLKFTAARSGKFAGNRMAVAYLDPGAINQALSVSVSGYHVLVSLATDGSGVITSTAAQVDAAIDALPAAAALMTPANAPANTGAGVVTAMPLTSLSGGTSNYAFFDNANNDAWLEGMGCNVMFLGEPA